MNSQEYRELDSLLKRGELKLQRMKSDLSLAHENNKQYQQTLADYNKVRELQNDIAKELQKFNILFKVCSAEDINYKNRRLSYVQEQIEDSLHLVYPDDGFKCTINFDFRYNKPIANLYLTNKKGKVIIPKLNEGDFCAQLICFTGTAALAESLGRKGLYLDEMFSAAHPDNLTKVSAKLKDLVDRGFQIVMIEQHTDVYRDLKRREIYVKKDPLTLKTNVVSTKDY